jgi:hypothetical protein
VKKWLLSGLGLGAGFLYLLDPTGKRRRPGTEDGEDGLAGVLAEARDAFGGEVDDEVLAARVRSRVRRAIDRPDEVHVAVANGVVTLSGTVAPTDFDRLVSAVLKVRGVHDVQDALQVRPTGT